MLTRAKVIEYAIVSLIGAVVSYLFSYYKGASGEPAVQEKDSSTAAASALSQLWAMDFEEMWSTAEAFVRRFWKILVGLGVMLLMEIIKELGGDVGSDVEDDARNAWDDVSSDASSAWDDMMSYGSR